MIIYTLRCEHNKFYVGKTNNLKKRFEEHKSGYGSKWTHLYKPIEIYHTFESLDSYDEDKQTLKMMKLYDIVNVRGGTWISLTLYPYEITMIQKMIYANNDQCFHCGHNGHFIRECPEKNQLEIKSDINQVVADISCWSFLSSFWKSNTTRQ